MNCAEWFIVAVMTVFTAACLVVNVRTGKIPNWLTIPALGLGLLARTVLGGCGYFDAPTVLGGLEASALGFATGFGLLLILLVIGGSGGGDVKMMSALGAWLGVKLVVAVFLTSAAVTVVIMGAAMLYNAGLRSWASIRRGSAAADSSKGKKAGGRKKTGLLSSKVLPYGVPLAVATWIVLAYRCYAGNLFLVTF